MKQFFEYQILDDINIISKCLDMDSSKMPIVVGCLNPHSFVTALDDDAFHLALKNCNFLLPDGEGICMSLKKYSKLKINKISGDELHQHLLSKLEKRSGKVFYMGSSEKVLDLIKKRLAKEYPSITSRTLSPSFCEELSNEESRQIISEINEFAPDVLFVSMTAPKQEKWVEKYRSLITNVKIIASIGAVFDFYSGSVKRAPKWVVKMRIEWLVRLIKEPRRMWRRNFVSTPRFLRYVRKNRHQICES